MKNNMRFWIAGLLAAMMLAVTACGGGQQGEAEPTAAPEGEAPAEVTDGEGAAGEATTELEIANAGEQLLYDKESLGPVPAGEEVTLTFGNDSAVNAHNWVLLNTGSEEEMAEFDAQAAAAGEAANYLPEDTSLVLVSSDLLDAGENATEEITFTVDSAGTYLYVCTVPGHYQAGMWGELTVQ